MKLADIMKNCPWKTAQQSPYGPVGPDNPKSDDLGLSPDMMEPIGDEMQKNIYLEVPLEEGEYDLLFGEAPMSKEEMIQDILARAQQWAHQKKQQGATQADFAEMLKQFFAETASDQSTQPQTHLDPRATPKERFNFNLANVTREFGGITITVKTADPRQIVFEVPSLPNLPPKEQQILYESLEEVVDRSVGRQSLDRVNSPPWR